MIGAAHKAGAVADASEHPLPFRIIPKIVLRRVMANIEILSCCDLLYTFYGKSICKHI